MSKVRRSREEWKGLVAAFRRSGASARNFAADNGLNRNTLLWWSATLGHDAVRPPLFVDVVVEDRADSLVVVVTSGHRVIVPARFDAAELRRLVDALC